MLPACRFGLPEVFFCAEAQFPGAPGLQKPEKGAAANLRFATAPSLVDLKGFEPSTPTMRMWCAPVWLRNMRY